MCEMMWAFLLTVDVIGTIQQFVEKKRSKHWFDQCTFVQCFTQQPSHKFKHVYVTGRHLQKFKIATLGAIVVQL